VIAGACEWVLLPTCVVLTHVVNVLVEPKVATRLLETCTADCPVWLYAPSPLNESAPVPTRPATHVGLVAPTRTPVFEPAESAAIVPLPSSKLKRDTGGVVTGVALAVFV
jgi:hypothetical protein